MLRNLLLALASLLVVFGVVEAGLRAAGYGNLEVYDPDPELFWRLRPGQQCRTKVGGHPVHVNEGGFRGRPLSLEKPPGTVRVIVLGDSATYGWGVGDDETYAAQLERRLAAAGIRAEVVNAGVNAYSLFQEEGAFRRALRWAPDAAVFAYAFNESWQDLQWLDERARRRVLRAVEWKNWLRRSAIYHAFGEIQLRVLYDRLRTQLATDVHGGRPRDLEARLGPYRATLERIERGAREAGVPVALLVLPTRGRRAPDPYQETMLAFARERGLPVLDLASGLDADPGVWFLPGDTVHPSPAGHADIARRLEPVVRALLAPRLDAVAAAPPRRREAAP